MAELQFLKDADFRREIKSSPAVGYLLFGEEDYLKNLAVAYARETLLGDPSLACFNEIILDALDFHPEKLRSALMSFPMMAERKVILVRGLDLNAMKASELDLFCEVLAELSEYDYNTLLLPVAADGLDEGLLPRRPSALLTKLCSLLRPVRYERCTPQKLIGWCIRHFEHNGAAITPDLCQLLIDRCGRNMMTLAGEIDKISYYALSHDRTAVTKADVETVASYTAEYDAFAFANAVMNLLTRIFYKVNVSDSQTGFRAITADALRPALMLENYPRSMVDIYIEVIEAEGGTRCAGITAAAVALVDAGVPMKDIVVGCAAGKVNDEVVLDLSEVEDKEGQADVPIAIMPRTGEITLLQSDGDLTEEEFQKAIDLAMEGCMQVSELQKEALMKKYSTE